MPKLSEVIREPKQRFIVKQICRTCVLAMPRTVKVAMSKAGDKVKPHKYSEKKL